jgi:hypothetical protein
VIRMADAGDTGDHAVERGFGERGVSYDSHTTFIVFEPRTHSHSSHSSGWP